MHGCLMGFDGIRARNVQRIPDTGPGQSQDQLELLGANPQTIGGSIVPLQGMHLQLTMTKVW